MSDEVERILEEEREKLRQVIGAIGGKPTRSMKIFNFIFLFAVITAFVLALCTHDILGTAMLEVGLLLLSLKFAVFLHNEARVNHFEFWMLTSIEKRINMIFEDLRSVKKDVKTLKAATADLETEKADKKD